MLEFIGQYRQELLNSHPSLSVQLFYQPTLQISDGKCFKDVALDFHERII